MLYARLRLDHAYELRYRLLEARAYPCQLRAGLVVIRLAGGEVTGPVADFRVADGPTQCEAGPDHS